jgi:glycosyltransferase involved in cell wall biosynthesis
MDEKRKNISIALIVRNEEENMEKCLKSICWSNDIVVIDQSSTDRTRDICEKYTKKVFITKPKGICNPDRMLAIEKSDNEWVLLLEADERVTNELKDEMLTIVNDVKRKEIAYYIPVKSFFLGKWIKTCGWYPGFILRLFKKGEVNYPPTIHSHGQTQGPCGKLKSDLIHLSYTSLSQYFYKFNRYTQQLAQEKFSKKRRVTPLNFLLLFFVKPLYFFLNKYFLKLGIRDGFRGFFISFSSALTVFVTYAKLWEMQNQDSKKSNFINKKSNN